MGFKRSPRGVAQATTRCNQTNLFILIIPKRAVLTMAYATYSMTSIDRPPRLIGRDRDTLAKMTSHPDLPDGSHCFTYFADTSPASPYHPVSFHIELVIPRGYPRNPPRVRFLTRIFHPYVAKDGDVDPTKCVRTTPICPRNPPRVRGHITSNLEALWDSKAGIEGVMECVNNFLNMPASRDWASLHVRHLHNEGGRSSSTNDATDHRTSACVMSRPFIRDVVRLKDHFHHPFQFTVSWVLLTIFEPDIARIITTFLDASLSLGNARTWFSSLDEWLESEGCLVRK